MHIKFDLDNVKRAVTEPWKLTDKRGNEVDIMEVQPSDRLRCSYSPDKNYYACRVMSVTSGKGEPSSCKYAACTRACSVSVSDLY